MLSDESAYTKVCVLDLDIVGVSSLKASDELDPIYVFIKPPGDEPLKVLEQRLRDRYRVFQRRTIPDASEEQKQRTALKAASAMPGKNWR